MDEQVALTPSQENEVAAFLAALLAQAAALPTPPNHDPESASSTEQAPDPNPFVAPHPPGWGPDTLPSTPIGEWLTLAAPKVKKYLHGRYLFSASVFNATRPGRIVELLAVPILPKEAENGSFATVSAATTVQPQTLPATKDNQREGVALSSGPTTEAVSPLPEPTAGASKLQMQPTSFNQRLPLSIRFGRPAKKKA